MLCYLKVFLISFLGSFILPIKVMWSFYVLWFFFGTDFLPSGIFLCGLFLFVCNREDNVEYHGGLQSRELGQAPYATGVPNS